MKAAVIGIGLIGGSFALTLKDKGICEEVIGVDNSERNRAKAVELGLVDRTLPLDEAIPAADLIVKYQSNCCFSQCRENCGAK